MEVRQDNNIVSTIKTVEWLINNTTVSTFDPVGFTGYQRQIDETHCMGIVKYLKDHFLMPSAIICACDAYSDNSPLRIVDGQHRVEALRLLKRDNIERYNQIADYQLPVIVLVNVPIETEIDTFITINKTSKKVDTSLAFVLRNKLSHKYDDNLAMSKAEFIAVETARIFNEDSSYEIWNDRILYEGAIKQSQKFISLNSYVRATRVLINALSRCRIISLDWHTKEQAQTLSYDVVTIINSIWSTVFKRWPVVFEGKTEERQIIQGSIGYTAITRSLVKQIKGKTFSSKEEALQYIEQTVMKFNADDKDWLIGGIFSRYSSESGYRYVSECLLTNDNK